MSYDLLNGDCIELMKTIPDESIDLILCDLPYGITASEWDKQLDYIKLWEHYERVIKRDGTIALFASGQFTYQLIKSNEKLYRYKWVWEKNRRGNFVNAKNRPLTAYEEICIFSFATTANGSKNKMRYYPQGLIPTHKVQKMNNKFGSVAGKRPSHRDVIQEFKNYPCDIIKFNSVPKPIHPSEKPIDLLEYLIKTYTTENDTVLDNCLGSGSTGIACLNTNRNFIGIEKDDNYFNLAKSRIEQHYNNSNSVINEFI